ncbi:sensor histidine kinase [Oleiharenicola sp. Vm1]|uniref:sensor histidine kinase n=1 Tax=Oleiharenicola sp. Vm1 TaxID=3398393 RepID=UPI0039F52192
MTEHRVVRWLILAALWVFVGLALSTEVYFNTRVMEPNVAFWSVAQGQFQRAVLWAVLVPVVVWLRDAVPLNRGRWVGGVSFHVTMSFALMAGFYLARVFVASTSWRESPEGFWHWAARGFYGRNLIDVVYYWTVIGVTYALRMRERYQRESLRSAQLEAQLVQAELKALKNQLNPHFLFNTMNTISVLVRDRRNDEAVQLIARLSTLLRALLESSRVHTVTLRQELDFLSRYLEIQQARFGERLRYEAEAEPEALGALVPNLFLQPVVENAILHGVAQKAEAGRVRISARVRGRRLQVEVRDDGPGFDARTAPLAEGVGLTNTRERLEKHYGADYQMVLKSEKGHGVTVSLVLPFTTSAAAAGA